MYLREVPAGVQIVIIGIEGHSGARKRLNELGLFPGQTVTVVQNNRFGPLTVKIMHGNIAVGHGLAQKIIVKPKSA